MGRFHALQPTFGGLFSVIPIRLTKAVVENGSDVGPFSPLPIHLCALCDLCGSPPHPEPKTFSDCPELAWPWTFSDSVQPSLLQESSQPRKPNSPFPLCASAPLREFSPSGAAVPSAISLSAFRKDPGRYPPPSPCSISPGRAQPVFQHFCERTERDRLGNVVVHPRLEALLAIALHGERGHRNDRNLAV